MTIKLFFRFILVFTLIFTALFVNAEESEILTPAAPKIAASSFILMDYYTGKILAENNADIKLAPASLTKIMTVYVAFREISSGHLNLTDLATVSQNAWKTGGSRMFLEVNIKVSIEDLIKGIVIQSGNDAAVALAEHIAGSESTFAEMMNQQAADL